MYWTAFWDSYESSINTLSDVDKFNYLRSLLEKSAYEAIAGLTLSAANYSEAIEILKKRFGSKQLIVSKHMEVLLNLEAATGEHDLKGLRSLQNEVEASVRSLKGLGVSSEYGTMLTPVLLTKLPPAIRLIVSRKITDADLNLEILQTALEEELVARERSGDPTRNVKWTHNHIPVIASTLLSKTQGFDGKQMCCYCQQTHSSGDCQVVKDINTRKQILKTSGRCFNCLRKGHIGKKCHTTHQCRSCNRKHHPSICDESASVKNVVSNP